MNKNQKFYFEIIEYYFILHSVVIIDLHLNCTIFRVVFANLLTTIGFI